MIINKVDSNILNNCEVNKWKYGIKIIQDCIDLGSGVYEIDDEEKIYTSNIRMKMYLDNAIKRNNNNKESTFHIRVKTKEKYTKVYVIVEAK